MLEIKVYSKKNISQILKIVLKRNALIVFKAVDNPFYRGAFYFTCFKNSLFEQAK